MCGCVTCLVWCYILMVQNADHRCCLMKVLHCFSSVENAVYTQQQAAPDTGYQQQQQYNNMQQQPAAGYQSHDAPPPIPLPNENHYNKPTANTLAAEEAELNFENGPLTFESSALKQQQQHEQSGKPNHSDGKNVGQGSFSSSLLQCDAMYLIRGNQIIVFQESLIYI